MKLLFVTDTHIRGTTPRNRRDNFPETLKTKLIEVMEIAAAHRVDAIIHGGDVFDRPDLAPAVVRSFASVLRDAPAPIYAVAGNHDVYGHNPETVGRTMLGLLDAFGTVRLLHPGEPVRLEKGGVTVQLSGQPFHYDIDRRDPLLDYRPADRAHADVTVHVAHGMVTDKPLPGGVPYTLLDTLWGPDAPDVLLTGHYHAGFGARKREGKWIVNPGALSRVNNQLAEVQRMPQVALLTVGAGIDVELLPLSCARPGEEVLDRHYVEQAAYREEKLTRFVQQVRAAEGFQTLELAQILDRLAGLTQVPDAVRAEALRRLAAAQERLAKGERSP
ncbi:MAG: metallophosphoesterase family protein [Calditerricola sp.]|nr:metallophosphoesterase family protein [Calditerricola sp.]